MHLFAVNVGTIVAALWLALGPLPAPPQPGVGTLTLTPSPEPPTAALLPTTTAAQAATVEPSPTIERPTVQPLPSSTAIPTAAATMTPSPTSPPSNDDPAVGIANPALTKRGSVAKARVGEMVEFTLVVTNNGNAPARGVVVTDALPPFLDLWNATTTRGVIAVNGRTVTITIGDVVPDDQITIGVMTRVNSLALPPDNRNTAVLSTTSDGNDPANDRAPQW